MSKFVKELESVIAEHSKTKILQLLNKINELEERGYEFSDEEERLIELMMTILDKMWESCQ